MFLSNVKRCYVGIILILLNYVNVYSNPTMIYMMIKMVSLFVKTKF